MAEGLLQKGLSPDLIKGKLLPIYSQSEAEHQKDIKDMSHSSFRFFFPKNSSLVTILRYDPRRVIGKENGKNVWKGCKYQLLTWNLLTNEVIPGQWITNKKVLKLCDLSHDGKYFLYAMHVKAKEGTGGMQLPEAIVVVSKPPYFTGLVVLKDIDYDGGYDYWVDKHVGGVWVDCKDPEKHQFVLPRHIAKTTTGKIPKDVEFSNLYVIPETPPLKSKEELLKMKNAELQAILVGMNLAKYGIKADLVDRILKNQEPRFYKQKDPGRSCTEVCVKHGQTTLAHETPINVHLGVVNGKLMVDGVEIYDFLKDRFQNIPPPEDYYN